jgi:hypothetical protein
MSFIVYRHIRVYRVELRAVRGSRAMPPPLSAIHSRMRCFSKAPADLLSKPVSDSAPGPAF